MKRFITTLTRDSRRTGMARIMSILLVSLALMPRVPVQAAEESAGVSATEAMQIMKDGNDRFVAGDMQFPNLYPARRQETAGGQHPFAVVLSCSDSRVPVEAIFDAGIGDIFVVRVAGNVAGVDETGSIEYAAEHLKTPLLLVLGHTSCGAVTAAATNAELSGSIETLVSRISPVAERVAEAHPNLKGKELVAAVIRANVWQSIEDLFNQSPLVCKLVKAGELTVKGALYNLDDGSVEWLGSHAKQKELVATRLAMPEKPVEQQVAAPATTEAHTAAPAAAVGGNSEKPSYLSELLSKLEKNIKAAPDQKATAAPAPVAKGTNDKTGLSVNQSELVDIVNDIEYLKAEVVYMRNLLDTTTRKLASIDEEGFYTPEQTQDFKALTTHVETLNSELEKLVAQKRDDGKNAPTVGHGRIAITGFLHEQYYNQPGSNKSSTFESKRARLGVSGDINDYAKITLVGEFAGTPKLMDGIVTFSPHKQWSLRMGQFQTPFGTDFLTSSTAMPFVTNSKAKGIGPDRDIGFAVSYRAEVPKVMDFKLTTGVFNGAAVNTADANRDKNFVGRLEWNLVKQFTLAPNFYVGKSNDPDSIKKSLSDWGSSLTWSWKNETVETEYIWSKLGDVKRGGWYVWGGHMFHTGLKFLPEIQTLARYEQYDPDLKIGGNRQDRVTFGTNLYIDKKYTKIQLNYQLNYKETGTADPNEFLANFQVAF